MSKPLPFCSFLPDVPDEEKGKARKLFFYSILYRMILPLVVVVCIQVLMAIATAIGWIPVIGWIYGFLLSAASILYTIFGLIYVIGGVVGGIGGGWINYYKVWSGESMIDDPKAKKMVIIATIISIIIPYLNYFPEAGGFLMLLYLKKKEGY